MRERTQSKWESLNSREVYSRSDIPTVLDHLCFRFSLKFIVSMEEV